MDAMTPKLVLKRIHDKSICAGMHGTDYDRNYWHCGLLAKILRTMRNISLHTSVGVAVGG